MRKSGSTGSRSNRRLFAVMTALMLFFLHRHSAFPEPRSSLACGPGRNAVEQLICDDPSLAALDTEMQKAFEDDLGRAAKPAERETRLAEQRAWLAGRRQACPVVYSPISSAGISRAAREVATRCLSRIDEQRVAILQFGRNTGAWPKIRFRPAIVEGAGTKLCDELEHDLVASFLGPGILVNPLGEREIGFAPIAALGNHPMVLRADIDAYNRGKPFPVLEWIADHGGRRLATVEYRAFGSPADLLSAIGRGGEPLERSVHQASRPVFRIDGLPYDEMPRFFRYGGVVYLLAPMRPVLGKPGDLGVYRLYGPAGLHRVCLFDAHAPMAHVTDNAISLPEVAALERAAGPMLPTGGLCTATGDEARALEDHAVWRPWVLERPRSPDALTGASLALYMRNRALTGPESARQYAAYSKARGAAVGAVAPYYRSRFGRTAGEANRLAALYLDRLIAGGFEIDPDDESADALFAPDYAEKHALQGAALAGDTRGLREALGPEPKAVAKGVTGDLDEPLVTDALEHPETLRALLDMGLDPDETGASGRTPLMVAARLDLVEAAGILLAHGAAPDRGVSAAVAQTDATGDALCLTGNAAAGDTPGRTALSYAAEFASPQMVRLLLDHDAAVAKTDSAGRRPADYIKRRAGDPAQSEKISELLR